MVAQLGPLFSPGDHAHLQFYPSSIGTSEVALLIIFFVFKSVVNGLIVLITGSGSQSRNKVVKTELPKLSISMPFKVTQNDIDVYVSATGCIIDQIENFKAQKTLFLSAITEPAMLLLIAKRGCPIQPLGSVNVRNTFELLRPDLCQLDTLKSIKGGAVSATLGSAARIVKRGLEIDLHIELAMETEANSTPVIIFRQIFTMLQFTKIPSSTKLSEITREPDFQFPIDVPSVGQFQIGWSDPSKWAKVCKDYNPIHIWGLAGKIYGLPGKIAHGNHVVAMTLREILREQDINPKTPCRMEVSFRRPIVVPAKLGVYTSLVKTKGNPVTHFAVGSLEKIGMQGRYHDI
ncbi:hypothetical protein ABW19_dt0204637 [Dactylella cylindrospora]|nr:hypothetical protein ABW19_dt0204637 [Dactylella cylindrospora]